MEVQARLRKSGRQETPSVGKHSEEREHLCNVGGSLNWHSRYGKQNGGSLKKLKLELPYDPAVPFLGI